MIGTTCKVIASSSVADDELTDLHTYTERKTDETGARRNLKFLSALKIITGIKMKIFADENLRRDNKMS